MVITESVPCCVSNYQNPHQTSCQMVMLVEEVNGCFADVLSRICILIKSPDLVSILSYMDKPFSPHAGSSRRLFGAMMTRYRLPILMAVIASVIAVAIVPGYSIPLDEIHGQIFVTNPQSYPIVGGEWVVHFVASGTHDLRVSGVDGTHILGQSSDVSFVSLSGPAEILWGGGGQ